MTEKRKPFFICRECRTIETIFELFAIDQKSVSEAEVFKLKQKLIQEFFIFM